MDIEDVLLKIGAWIVSILFILFLLIIAATLVAIVKGVTPDQIHYKQCIEDGQKEYECYAMIYGNRGRVR